jgi:hypothetical protein
MFTSAFALSVRRRKNILRNVAGAMHITSATPRPSEIHFNYRKSRNTKTLVDKFFDIDSWWLFDL